MRSQRFVAAILWTAGAATLAAPGATLAQGNPPGRDTTAVRPAADTGSRLAEMPEPRGRVVAAVDVGARAFSTPMSTQQRGKFDEYRDIRSGVLLQQLALGYAPADGISRYRLTASDVGLRDQRIALRAKQPGLYDVQLSWDRIPHTFSTDGRSLFTETSRGVYTLPTPRPDTATFNRAPYVRPIRTMWDPVKLAVGVTPSQAWDFRAEYTRIGKSGDRPIGQPFGSPGANANEIREPIDQTIHDLRVSQSYAQRRFQFAAAYDLSVFQNHITSVTSDNPLVITDTPAAGSSRGRTSLAPDNLAHTVVVNSGLDLPLHSRVAGNASFSWWRQNQDFIPSTINSAIVDPRLAQVPASLGASARTTNLGGTVTMRPFSFLSLSGRYRSYAFRDNADVSAIPIIIVNDRSVSPADTARRDPFTRRNADLNASWQLLQPLSLSAGFAWESMERDPAERQVLRTSERMPRVTLDFTGFEWLNLRASYSKGWRRGTGYDAGDENPDSRRFDEADRNRERTNLMASVTPFTPVTISGSWQVGHDLYPSSRYGVQSDRNTAVGGDLSFTLTRWLSGGAGLVRETFDDLMRARYRAGTQLNNPTYDWVGNNTDVETATTANLMATLIPDRLEAGGSYELSRAHYVMATSNPIMPTGGTVAQNASATAVDLPRVSQTLQPIGAYVRYLFGPEWAFTVRYNAELYRQTDYKTRGLKPARQVSATGLFVFFANDFQNYDARYFTFTFSYRPQSIHIGRSVL